MRDGSKPIEQFRTGDLILSSVDDPEAAPATRRVQELIRSRGQLVDITVNGRMVQATREHPFYVKDKGWTPAASLAAGDLLRSHDKRWLALESIVDAGNSAVYNVRVQENATYFVGDRDWGFSLWVNDGCAKRDAPQERLAKSKKVHPRLRNTKSHSRR